MPQTNPSDTLQLHFSSGNVMEQPANDGINLPPLPPYGSSLIDNDIDLDKKNLNIIPSVRGLKERADGNKIENLIE